MPLCVPQCPPDSPRVCTCVSLTRGTDVQKAKMGSTVSGKRAGWWPGRMEVWAEWAGHPRAVKVAFRGVRVDIQAQWGVAMY